MLSSNFLGAKQLGIPQLWWSSLVRVLFDLERNALDPFDMRYWDCCMGGWAERFGQFTFPGSHLLPPSLEELFYPAGGDITDEMAASALRDYLTTGEVNYGRTRPSILAARHLRAAREQYIERRASADHTRARRESVCA